MDDDTRPEVRTLVSEMLAKRSGCERVRMGDEMFEAARKIVMASFPKDLEPGEIRCLLFSRFYGQDFSSEEGEEIRRRLRLFNGAL